MTLRTPAFNDARTYGFEWLRASTEALAIQEGVIGATDLRVTAAVAGLQRVDIAGGAAFVKGDSGTPGTGLTQGLYYVVNDASVANAVTLTASNGTNPRIDQIILRVLDTSDLGSASDSAVFEVVTGTATAGATLDNRTGAAALPNDAIRLADVLVPAGSTATSAGNIRDRRPWGRGATYVLQRTAGNITVNGAGYADVDSTFRVRLEFAAGNLVVPQLIGSGAHSIAAGRVLTAMIGGTGLVPGSGSTYSHGNVNITAGGGFPIGDDFPFVSGGGSTLIAAQAWNPDGGTATLDAAAAKPLTLIVREIVAQNGVNQ